MDGVADEMLKYGGDTVIVLMHIILIHNAV